MLLTNFILVFLLQEQGADKLSDRYVHYDVHEYA